MSIGFGSHVAVSGSGGFFGRPTFRRFGFSDFRHSRNWTRSSGVAGCQQDGQREVLSKYFLCRVVTARQADEQVLRLRDLRRFGGTSAVQTVQRGIKFSIPFGIRASISGASGFFTELPFRL